MESLFEEKPIYQILQAKKTISLKQVHGRDILSIDTPEKLEDCQMTKKDLVYDGVITSQPNVCLAIKHADCAPVSLFSEKKEIIGILHCGWRSIQKQIIKQARDILNEKFHWQGNIFFEVGPTICWGCYEVGAEMIDEFDPLLKENGLKTEKYFKPKTGNKYFFDLKKIIVDLCLKNDFHLSKVSEICTFENLEYHSFRRNKTMNRNISFMRK